MNGPKPVEPAGTSEKREKAFEERMRMISDKKLFITGGAGFIGSTLISRLVDHNRIIIYDNLRQAMDGANIVVHCVAIAGIDTIIKKPTEMMWVNIKRMKAVIVQRKFVGQWRGLHREEVQGHSEVVKTGLAK